MLRKIMGTATFTLGSLITLYYQREEAKRILARIADKETVTNEYQYVLVCLARGRYNNDRCFEMMWQDFKFYRIIDPTKNQE